MAQVKQKTVDGTTVKLFKTGSGRDATYRVEVGGRVVRDNIQVKEGAFDVFAGQVQELKGNGSSGNGGFLGLF